jgi:hypothetical protein
MGGQVIRRDEQDNRYPAYNRPHENGDPHEIWFRFAGKQMGYSGNNGTTDTDYASSIAARTRAAPTTTTGAFRGGAAFGGAHTDFDNSLKSLNSYEQGGAGGGYTVRGGDTLSGIAANLWGDAGLWYKLAEANGLSQQSALTEGQRLTIPSGVTKNTHNAGTFKPYDPAEAIGETSPTNPAPNKAAKKNKCGAFGAILLVIVAVAVTAVVAPWATGIAAKAGFSAVGAAVVGGAVAGAAGSIASQTVGVATGIQDKFSWKGVALSALSGAVGGGLGKVGGTFGKFTNGGSLAGNVVRGALGSTITQGVAVATGLQKKFDWAGVAAAGIAAGAGHIVGNALGAQSFKVDRSLGNVAANALTGGARAIASAATRSLIEGTNFGDNVLAALPDAIGQTIGDFVADSITNPETLKARLARIERESTAMALETTATAQTTTGPATATQ